MEWCDWSSDVCSSDLLWLLLSVRLSLKNQLNSTHVSILVRLVTTWKNCTSTKSLMYLAQTINWLNNFPLWYVESCACKWYSFFCVFSCYNVSLIQILFIFVGIISSWVTNLFYFNRNMLSDADSLLSVSRMIAVLFLAHCRRITHEYTGRSSGKSLFAWWVYLFPEEKRKESADVIIQYLLQCYYC